MNGKGSRPLGHRRVRGQLRRLTETDRQQRAAYNLRRGRVSEHAGRVLARGRAVAARRRREAWAVPVVDESHRVM
jgi:hypothetical protein